MFMKWCHHEVLIQVRHIIKQKIYLFFLRDVTTEFPDDPLDQCISATASTNSDEPPLLCRNLEYDPPEAKPRLLLLADAKIATTVFEVQLHGDLRYPSEEQLGRYSSSSSSPLFVELRPYWQRERKGSTGEKENDVGQVWLSPNPLNSPLCSFLVCSQAWGSKVTYEMSKKNLHTYESELYLCYYLFVVVVFLLVKLKVGDDSIVSSKCWVLFLFLHAWGRRRYSNPCFILSYSSDLTYNGDGSN